MRCIFINIHIYIYIFISIVSPGQGVIFIWLVMKVILRYEYYMCQNYYCMDYGVSLL